uniref:Uncharacterized protein TCIL3000_11_14150 n=1 Tax=Trypanosoma congolense (strain IL3000) TaxID=1068625 RepID=G0V2M8_TRYCI|nr:unnamed protein product [Trypanosoma congolense IL3000]
MITYFLFRSSRYRCEVMPQKSFLTGRRSPKGSESSAVEILAERVFVWCPRLFSFSHRVLSSVRHPYLAVTLDRVDYDGRKRNNRIELLLGALTESRDEENKWTRVAQMFDSMLTADVLDKLRRKVALSADVMICIETLWNGVGGVVHGILKEDDYKALHYKLYSFLLNIDDVNVVTSSSAAISEDFIYDQRNNVGVTFEYFAISMLELADNWTRTRDVSDYINFLRDINKRCVKSVERPSVRPPLPYCRKSAFFSGGIIRKVADGDSVSYEKVE